MLLTVKDLSARLQIKASTLYAWAAQGKIPCCRIHGLIRFDPDAITHWLQRFTDLEGDALPKSLVKPDTRNVDELVARVVQAAYNQHGETRPKSSLIGKEEKDGAV